MIIPSKFDGYGEGGRLTSTRRVYDSGGSSQPTTQTQISELPDWAKPYAQETLEKGKALSSTPYQNYTGDRIAGFSPLQQQAQTAVAQMQPSQATRFGGQVAGAASLGALNTGYNPFRMGEFTSNRAAQYMNPFVEMAMEPQLREAQRSSDIQRVADQAQATRAGAFGGSRQAILEAERQRNLGTQMGDIRAKGYMSAYDQAQQNFAREQQLREQSRQYGAGLGLQSLQTALQGANTMGQLGGQEFAQGMDINKLQQQVGAQQQALQQQGLTQAYQDFLNQQNYPYKQLGFMSDLIRGLPLGQQSTAQVYQPPGSLAGQVAGIGMGAYGLSRAFGGFAEGGEVYAEGGVTSEQNVDNILDGLSDIQLQQAKVAALDRGDKQRVDMIDAELAQRASLRAGLGNAFDSLSPESQESVFSAASGGMVAFADGGNLGVSPEFEVGEVESTGEGPLTRLGNILSGKTARGGKSIEEYYGEQRNRPAAAAVRNVGMKESAESETRGSMAAAKPPREAGTRFTRQDASSAVNTLIQGTGVQVPEDKTIELQKTLFDESMRRSKPDRDAFRAELEAVKGRAKEIEARGIGEALAKFGFGMAAAAAKPGRRQGLAGIIESGATASPLLAESLAETQKLKAAAQDNYMKMRMENARYETALEQGNMQLAGSLANNISQRKIAQATLQQQIAQNDRMFALEKEKLGVMRTQASSPTAIQKIANDLMQEDPSLSRKSALQEASRIAGYSFKTDAATGGKLATELRKIDEEFSTLKFLDPQSKMGQNLAAQRQQRIAEAYRLYGSEQPGGVTSAQPPAAGAGQMRIVGVR